MVDEPIPEVSNTKNKPLLLRVNGKYYDLALFEKKHPGGGKVLRDLAGEDVDDYMSGKKRIHGIKHTHGEAAYKLLEPYALEKCPTNSDEILHCAVLGKVADLRDGYWTWIHQPFDGALRLFESDYLEIFTRTKWWVIPLVWMPLVLFYGLKGLFMCRQMFGILQGFLFASFMFGLGGLAWTLLEYLLHRFAFHWEPNPKSDWQIVFHFLLHGLHHKTPMDGDRLVFPPVPAVPIVGFFYCLYILLLPYHIFCCFAAGKLFGYIVYDLSHYYLHHGDPQPPSGFHYRKVYHYNHHFKDYDVGFGISTVIWDYVFGTVGTGPEY
uniref:Fatty acid 2-hydroxylase n=1 Tax=Syphacia muris TaxID=451379 RepID=A0A0N5AMY3_9BILA